MQVYNPLILTGADEQPQLIHHVTPTFDSTEPGCQWIDQWLSPNERQI